MTRVRMALGALILVAITGAGCLDLQEDIYTAFYYPDYTNLYVYETSGPLASLEECRDWVDQQDYSYTLQHPYEQNSHDYECGTNCKYDPSWDMYKCDETLE